MSSYLDKTGLERVWSKATNKFATIATTDELRGNIETLTSTKADKTEVETAVAGLVDSAPETLNTLNELSAALGDDPNFATTISTQIGNKVNKNTYDDEVNSLRASINQKLPLSGGTVTGALYFANSATYPALYFKPSSDTNTRPWASMQVNEPANSTNSCMTFSVYSRSSEDYSRLNYYEAFRLPYITPDLKENKYYDIITSKGGYISGNLGISGDLSINGGTEQKKIKVNRTVNNSENSVQLALNLDNTATLRYWNGSTAINGLTLATDHTALEKPLDISSGGTGSITAEGALTNLGALSIKDYRGPVIKEGNPVVYDNGAEGLNIAVVSTLSPIQEGSGDPYPAGGGKNIIDIYSMIPNSSSTLIERTNNTIRVYNTTAGTYNRAYISDMVLKAGVTYTLSAEVTAMPGGFARVGFVNQSTVTTITNSSIIFSEAGKGTTTFSVTEDTAVYFAAWCSWSTSIAGDATFKNIQVEIGDTSTDYMPYENIRPISGWTGAKMTRCGKNLCNEELVQGTRSTDGVLSAGTWAVAVTIKNLVPVVPGMVVYVNTSKGAFNGAFRHYLYDADMQLISTVGGVAYNAAVAIPEGVAYFAIQYAGTDYADYIGTYLMVSNGEFAAYEPYQGNAYAADFGQTVYGGTLDWKTGVLTVGWRIARLTSNGNWVKSGTALNGYYLTDSALFPNKLAFAPVVCNIARYVSDIDEYKTNYGTIYADNTVSMNIAPSVCGSTLESFKAWLDANDVQIAYKLANPTTTQLTPAQITELAGTNTVYGDGDSLRVVFNSSGSGVANAVKNSLTIKGNGTILDSYNGSEEKEINITATNIDAIPNDGNPVINLHDAVGGEYWGFERKITALSDTIGATGLRFTADGAYRLCRPTDGSYRAYKIFDESQTVPVANGGTGSNTRTGAWNNIVAAGGTMSGNLVLSHPTGGETHVSINYGTDKNLMLWGNNSTGTHGLWDSAIGYIISINDTAATFTGSLSGNASSASKVNSNLAIKLNSGTTEGTNLFTFNGSAAKTINITPSAIGALSTSGGTLSGNLSLRNSNQYPRLDFTPNFTTSCPAFLYYNTGAASKYGSGSNFFFRQYSATAANSTTSTSYYDDFKIPDTIPGKTSNGYYYLLSTRDAVTIAQGGTGATSKSGARTNLGILSGTSLPAASSYASGDIFVLYE